MKIIAYGVLAALFGASFGHFLGIGAATGLAVALGAFFVVDGIWWWRSRQ
jgi:hypothetical protein